MIMIIMYASSISLCGFPMKTTQRNQAVLRHLHLAPVPILSPISWHQKSPMIPIRLRSPLVIVNPEYVDPGYHLFTGFSEGYLFRVIAHWDSEKPYRRFAEADSKLLVALPRRKYEVKETSAANSWLWIVLQWFRYGSIWTSKLPEVWFYKCHWSCLKSSDHSGFLIANRTGKYLASNLRISPQNRLPDWEQWEVSSSETGTPETGPAKYGII